VDIINKVYNRSLEKALVDEINQREAIMLELQSVRKMAKEFKQTEEASTKIITELQQKYDMIKEERVIDNERFEKRLNQLIRDFVATFKVLETEFNSFRSMVNIEMDIHAEILKKKNKVIQDQKDDVH